MPQDQFTRLMQGSESCAVENSCKQGKSSRKYNKFKENQNVLSNNNQWLRFHSYDAKAHEDKKRKTREISKRNSYKGIQFKPSKYMQDNVIAIGNMLGLEKNLNERSVIKSSTACSTTLQKHSPKIPLTHTFQVSSIQLDSLISNNQQSIQTTKSTCCPQLITRNTLSRKILPSINEILFAPTSNMSICQNSTSHQENLTLPPFNL